MQQVQEMVNASIRPGSNGKRKKKGRLEGGVSGGGNFDLLVPLGHVPFLLILILFFLFRPSPFPACMQFQLCCFSFSFSDVLTPDSVTRNYGLDGMFFFFPSKNRCLRTCHMCTV